MPGRVNDADDRRSNRERMLAGDPYIPDDPDNHRQHLRALSLAAEFAATYPADEAAALAILSELLGHLGTGAVIKPPLWVDYGTHLQVGDETFINTGLVVLDAAPVTIGPARVVKEV